MRIDWTKWSAIAEITSSAAILLTLAYLAVQTQQNTDALLASTRQAALETEIGYLQEAVTRPEVRAVIGLEYPEDPRNQYDDDTFVSAMNLLIILFRMRESQWLNFRAGVLDLDVWEPYRGVLIEVLNESEVARIAWDRYSIAFTPGFKEEIDSMLNP